RDHIPIVPPSPTRLLARIGPLSGERLGLELLIALLLGVPALIGGVLRRPDRSAPPSSATAAVDRDPEDNDSESDTDTEDEHSAVAERNTEGYYPAVADADTADGYRMRRAVAGGLAMWLLTGIALFSEMARLHPRYVEGLVPAVTATFGIGAAWACSSSGRARLLTLTVGMAVLIVYADRLLYGRPESWWIALAGALGAVAVAGLARLRVRPSARSSTLFSAAALAMTLVAVAAIPLGIDATTIENRVTDAGYVGGLPGEEQRLLSAYLRGHQDGARYELAAESATQIGSLIVQDARPVVVLTTYEARVFTSIAKLQRLIAAGAVRYAFLNTYCGRHTATLNAACSAPAKWIRANGTDVSRQAGLSRHKVLWLLPGAKP
ncbi:MAG TPA: hypothetical protein VFC30_08575, partial [Solirubrobacteraceae bacterium]|nr:hypothetical protein [Solirubrobacteraceae bacterium]